MGGNLVAEEVGVGLSLARLPLVPHKDVDGFRCNRRKSNEKQKDKMAHNSNRLLPQRKNAQHSGCGFDATESTAVFHDLVFDARLPWLGSSSLVPRK